VSSHMFSTPGAPRYAVVSSGPIALDSSRMKSTLDHLPERQQQELARVRTTLLDEFEAAIGKGAGGTSDWRKGGQVLKIILFGSYARNDWVDEPDNGYLSDFDLLVIVSHPKLTDIADYWWVAEDKILRDPQVGRTVNLIVHDLAEVNQALSRGEYFWTDIARDGVMLYELPGHPLATPRPMTLRDASELAQRYFSTKIADVDAWLRSISRSKEDWGEPSPRKNAAFQLHQAAEAAYICFLLVHTFYFPRSHNIKFLRSLAEDVDKRLIDAWPREHRLDRRRFETLKRAYVEARYSDQYDISADDLEALAASVRQLRDLVASACEERIQELRARAHGQ
jgi:predicted nucleotidyltransferase/HEPN domain-containing protein